MSSCCESEEEGGIHERLPSLRVYVGYDPRLDLPYEITKYSMLKRASFPVEVIPLKQSALRESNIYSRARNPEDITEFTLTRFLTPHLAGFTGWAMFVDSDFLYTGDLRELADLVDDKFAVMCVKHDYSGRKTTMMDGLVRPTYPRLNWSSMMLWNCSHAKNRILTPEFVNSQPADFLQKLKWLEDDEIGAIPQTWNFLVGHSHLPDDDTATAGTASTPPKAIHFTEGGPWYDRWTSCQFSELWFQERDDFEHSQQVQGDIQDKLVKLIEKTSFQGCSGIEPQNDAITRRIVPDLIVEMSTTA